jgi:hypothetical protein
MSRRCHHGSPRHAHATGRVLRRPLTSAPPPTGQATSGPASGTPATSAQPLPVPPIPMEPVVGAAPALPPANPPVPAAERVAPTATHAPAREMGPSVVTPMAPLPIPASRPATNGHPMPMQRPNGRPSEGGHGPAHHEDEPAERGATGPQLRRFIKSRAYVPMHELRRRFLINGGDDDVTPVDLGERRRVFVGLPEREGRLLGELLRGGDIGYELSLDPISPIVVGVYPMRPVTRA